MRSWHTSSMFSRTAEALPLTGDPSSLTSLKLARRPSEWPLFLLWGNLTPRRDLPVMVKSVRLSFDVGYIDHSKCYR